MPMEALRNRLLADRIELVDLLIGIPADRHLDPGFIRMLADIQTALSAVDAMAVTKEPI